MALNIYIIVRALFKTQKPAESYGNRIQIVSRNDKYR